MKYSLPQAAQAFCLALRDTQSEQLPELTEGFVELIIAERLGSRAELILSAVNRAWDEVNHDRMVRITTARPQTDLIKKISHDFPEAEITSAVDPRLQGGVIIQIGDRLLDASITTKLKTLQAVLVT